MSEFRTHPELLTFLWKVTGRLSRGLMVLLDPDPEPALERCADEDAGRGGERRPTDDGRGSCPGVRCWLDLTGLPRGFGLQVLPTCSHAQKSQRCRFGNSVNTGQFVKGPVCSLSCRLVAKHEKKGDHGSTHALCFGERHGKAGSSAPTGPECSIRSENHACLESLDVWL